jgi:pimeloyl-ACP methyl ester carboxylesterase
MKTASSLLIACTLAFAQGRGNRPTPPIPALGIQVPAPDRADLETGLRRLQDSIERIRKHPLAPDVLIYHEAVRYALQYSEFLKPDELGKARKLLDEGQQRADLLAQGQAPWTTATGLVVRGYVSRIDKSVQPYGLVVPASYAPNAPHRWRLDAWFHGRSETLTEVNFLTDREKNTGEFAPRDTIMLHLYGRFCNASKLAGEVDFFEALDAVKKAYPIDENRIVIRGFSMGGASAWHIGAHYAGLWAAVAPGAGFSESPQFLHLALTGPNAPPEWEQTLYRLYDMSGYAINLSNTATIAYNGEIDPQKQAADVMEKAMAEEGMRLTRVIGPQTPHRYRPDSKIEIDRMLDAIVSRGRDPWPRTVRFTTWTLAYNRMNWVVVDGLGKHWERARLNAEITGDTSVAVDSSNVTAFSLEFGPGGCPLDLSRRPVVTIDGQKVEAPTPMSDRSWTAHFRKTGSQWSAVDAAATNGKRHGLQGPVDDAFLDSFVFVTPTGTPVVPAAAEWVAAEQKHAITEWRHHFRGEAQVRADTGVTDADIASSNLVLWGDPGSNRILSRIADKLPVQWTADAVVVRGQRYPAATHVPVLIYPNPLNPSKYVVLNSGFTFREFDYLNNARQIPKLPDWAVVDTTTPPNDRYPGKIVSAGFFNEDWK